MAAVWLALVLPGLTRGDTASRTEPDLIRWVENQRLRALVDMRMDVAKALHGDDYQLITPSGLPMTRDEYLDAIASRKLHYLVFEPVSAIVIRLYENAAVLRYQAHIEFEWNGVRGRGGRFWHTDVYEKRDGRWVAVWSQATEIWQDESAPPGSVPQTKASVGQ